MLLCKAKGIEESEEEMVVLVKSLQTRDEQLQLDFRREAEMFGKLSHPNVARLLGLCKEAEPHYMILDYYDLVTEKATHWQSAGLFIYLVFIFIFIILLFSLQGDLKQFLRISKSKDDKVKSQPISTKTKVSINHRD